MTGTRSAPDETTDPSGIGGDVYAQEIKAEIDDLWEKVITPLGTIGGTGNAITAVGDPPLTAAYVAGQHFRMTVASANTGAVTVNIDGRGAVALRDQDGAALVSGDLVVGRTIEFFYDGSVFRLTAPTLRAIVAATGAGILDLWKILGDTTIAGPVATVEHTFTAGAYSMIVCVFGGLSGNHVAGHSLVATLRHAGGLIVTVTGGGGALAAANVGGGVVRFFVDLVNATKTHAGVMEGVIGATSLAATGVGSHATAPDRVRLAFDNGSIDSGRIITYGLAKQ